MAEGIRSCHRCEGSLPPGSRSDRKFCGRACQEQARRRSAGEVVDNHRACSSCGASLAGMYANARTCRSRKCRTWNQRHPGVLHPSQRPRRCGWCADRIDHLNAKGRYCSKGCTDSARRDADRDAYNAKARRWQQSDVGTAYRRTYQQANGDHRQEWARADRAQNPERYAAYWKQWADSVPSQVHREREHVRRARKRGNPGSVGVSLRDWQRLVRRYRGCCAYCGQLAVPLHMDHVVPLAKGGRHAIGNVLPSCGRCNTTKYAMFLVVWRLRRRLAPSHIRRCA